MRRPLPNWISDREIGSRIAAKKHDITLITPMFGGGAETSVNDPVTPIRVPSIRGQLRFWWRVIRGADCNHGTLLKQESEIWGSTENPSPVKILVESSSLVEGLTGTQWCGSHPGLNYVLYNLSTRTGSRHSFTLSIHTDGASEDIEAAMRAWVNLGGLGARTRRGCGALYCAALPGNKWLEADIQSTERREWPIIGETLRLSSTPVDPLDAWELLVNKWHQFRQVTRPSRDRDHMASPILLRPIAVGPNQAIPVIIRLEEPDGFETENQTAREFLRWARDGAATP